MSSRALCSKLMRLQKTSPQLALPINGNHPCLGQGNTGKPFYKAIVWQDTRTDKDQHKIAEVSGQNASRNGSACPLPPISPAQRSSWILDNVEGVRRPLNKPRHLWQHRHVDHLEITPVGVNGGLQHHRRHQRQPYHADGPENPPWDPDICEVMGIPISNAARNPSFLPSLMAIPGLTDRLQRHPPFR